MVEKEDFSALISFIGGIIGAASAWIAGLGIISVLISVGLGSLLTYIVGSKTQRKTWKREATLRKIDTIYGPLYEEITETVELFSNDVSIVYDYPSAEKWTSIKKKYYYLLIDADLRNELSRFYELLEQVSTKKYILLNSTGKLLFKNLRERSGRDVDSISCEIILEKDRKRSTADLDLKIPISNGKHPLDYAKRIYPSYDFYDFEVTMNGPELHRRIQSAEEKRMLDEVIQKTIEEINKDSVTHFLKDTSSKILRSAQSLKYKLGKIIAEPWRV